MTDARHIHDSPLIRAPHLRAPSCLRPPHPFHVDRECNKVSQPPPFPRPPHLHTSPFAQAASRPTGVVTPFASPVSSPALFAQTGMQRELVCTPFQSCAVTSLPGFSPPH